jgi:hypothetical protein
MADGRESQERLGRSEPDVGMSADAVGRSAHALMLREIVIERAVHGSRTLEGGEYPGACRDCDRSGSGGVWVRAGLPETELKESQRQPANWLLVYDLLADVVECVERIENPSRTRYQPVRYWAGDFNSPAATALEMMYVPQMESQGGCSWVSDSSSGGFDSGGGGDGGGFDTSGGFGGGDSGGGGSSSGY